MVELVIEVVAEFLFRPLIALIRFIGIVVMEGIVFRPVYWLGWCILKTISLGKLPEKTVNDCHWSEILCWVLGLAAIVLAGIGVSY